MKNLLIAFLTLAFFFANGQNSEHLIEPVPLKSGASIEDSYGERWYNQLSELSAFSLATPLSTTPLYGMSIFPDSTIIFGVSEGNPVYAYFHGAATVINPFYTLDEWITPDGTVTVDSFALDYRYVRNLDSNVVDTLIISYIESHGLFNYFDINDNGEVDDQEFKHQILLDGEPGNLFPKTVMVQSGLVNRQYIQYSNSDTVLLTYEDSVADRGLKRLYRDIDIRVTPEDGGRVGAFVQFKPGYTWTMNDTLSNKNYFEVITAEQIANNPGTAGPVDFFRAEFGGGSHVLRKKTLYNEYTGNSTFLNGQLEYTAGFSESWLYEHHLMWFKISHPNVGVDELAKSEFAVYPNPSESIVNVQFEESYIVGTGLLEVFNVEGKLLESLLVDDSTIQLDVSSWQPGFYILRAGGYSNTLIIK